MSYTVGDYLFARIAQNGVRRVLGQQGGSLFIGSVQRNNLCYENVYYPTRNSYSGEIGAFVVSSLPEDLANCYYRGSLMFPSGAAVYVVERGSAQFQDPASISSKHYFASVVIINSPATAASQINRALDVMVRERRPVYIGLSLEVAGQPMPGYSAAAQVASGTQSISTAESASADAAVAMGFI